MLGLFTGRHDIQHNDTQHNDTQHNGIQHNDTQYNDIQHNDTQHNKSKIATLNVRTLSIIAHGVLFMLNALYAECRVNISDFAVQFVAVDGTENSS